MQAGGALPVFSDGWQDDPFDTPLRQVTGAAAPLDVQETSVDLATNLCEVGY
jgi:hypothetical protein